MSGIVLYEDDFYRYSYIKQEWLDKYFIHIEFKIKYEDRKDIKSLVQAPDSNMEVFRQKLKDHGICDESILNKLKISLDGLCEGCFNLENISVLCGFNFTNVDNYVFMFKECMKLGNETCGFDIINHEIIRDQLSNGSVQCAGMFTNAYKYQKPSWVDSRLWRTLHYDY